MSEWLSGNLGDIADIVMGQSPTGESVNTNGLGVPLLNGPTEFTIRYPKAVQFSTDPKRFSKVNDILFCVRGSTTGRMNWADEDYAIGRGLAAIRHKQGEEYRYFVKAILDYYLDTMLASASGSTFPNVSKDQLNELEISYPSFPEQKAIASVLSSLDDKIDLLHRQNKTLEAMAETLFRQWFIEEAKEDWENGVLEQLIDLKYGKALKQEDRSGSGYPVVASSGIVGFHKEYLVEGPGIVIGRKGTLGKVYFMEGNFYPIDTSYFIQTKTSGSNLIFEYYLLKSLDFANMNSDSAVPGLNRNIALGTQIQIPPVELILNFNETVQPWFSKIHSNTKQIQTLENLRDTLLPKLMSGEVRVQYQTEEVA